MLRAAAQPGKLCGWAIPKSVRKNGKASGGVIKSWFERPSTMLTLFLSPRMPINSIAPAMNEKPVDCSSCFTQQSLTTVGPCEAENMVDIPVAGPEPLEKDRCSDCKERVNETAFF